MELGEKPTWGSVLGVVFAERNRQVPWIATLVMLLFMFWVFAAHAVFALVMGISAMAHMPNLMGFLTTQWGLILLALEMGIGSAFAFLGHATWHLYRCALSK